MIKAEVMKQAMQARIEIIKSMKNRTNRAYINQLIKNIEHEMNKITGDITNEYRIKMQERIDVWFEIA